MRSTHRLPSPSRSSPAMTPAATVTMTSKERAALSRRLEQLAAEALKSSRSEVTWEQDGRQYSALLIRERANEGTALERVTAQVSASDNGKQLTTLVNLNRLAFSQFTQMIDRWDPMVQLHDDEIVGRFHTNSRFSLLADARSAPKFLGKVTTTARSFNNGIRAGGAGTPTFSAAASRRGRAKSSCRSRRNRSSGRRATSTRAFTSSPTTRGSGFSPTAVIAGPICTRRKRKYLQRACRASDLFHRRRVRRRCTWKASSPARCCSIRPDAS